MMAMIFSMVEKFPFLYHLYHLERNYPVLGSKIFAHFHQGTLAGGLNVEIPVAKHGKHTDVVVSGFRRHLFDFPLAGDFKAVIRENTSQTLILPFIGDKNRILGALMVRVRDQAAHSRQTAYAFPVQFSHNGDLTVVVDITIMGGNFMGFPTKKVMETGISAVIPPAPTISPSQIPGHISSPGSSPQNSLALSSAVQ